MRTGNFNLKLKDSQRNGSVVNGLGSLGDGVNPIFEESIVPEVELRWIRLNAGDEKTVPHTHEGIRTLIILMRGQHVVTLVGQTISLENEGDYLFIEQHEEHTWQTKKDTLLAILRWKV
jgi:hypothetical protein